MDNDKKTLHELGFRSKPGNKKRTKNNSSKKLPTQPPTSTTFDRFQERF